MRTQRHADKTAAVEVGLPGRQPPGHKAKALALARARASARRRRSGETMSKRGRQAGEAEA